MHKPNQFLILYQYFMESVLAYTLARNTRQDKNPLRSGDGSLQVVDFGCGSLAMQFGIALAAADTVVEHGRIPGVAIVSEDNSAPMRDMGLKILGQLPK